MCRAIEAAYRIDEVKDIRDKAVALEAYAKQAMNVEAEEHAHQIRLRAERRAGQLLREMKESGERTGKGQPKVMSSAATLKDLGIIRDQSSKWQRLTDMPKADFEAALTGNGKVSTNGLVK
jgi:hypothetical protein